MKTEDWLARVRGIDQDIQWLQKEYRKALEQATGTTVQVFGEKVQSGSGNRTEDKLLRVSDYAAEIKAALEEKQKIKKEVFLVIEKVGNVDQRLLLRMYYIDGKAWEDVADEIARSPSYVKGPLRKAAIEKVQRIREQYSL